MPIKLVNMMKMLYNMHDMSSDFMGKKIFVFLSLFVVPNFCWAAGNDYCTNPKDYTIDKRCYVTEEQKLQKPYNAVVSLRQDLCTGTIVNVNNVPYVFTAKHCTDVDKDKNADDILVAKLQDGTSFNVYKNNVGSYDLETRDNRYGDWAIYRVDKSINEVPSVVMNRDAGNYNVRVVGYGTLKIMSDAEIVEFRQLYLDYLDNTVGDARNASYMYGYSQFSPVVDTKNVHVKQFIKNMDVKQKYKFFKDNTKLKESNCYYNNGKEVNCQTWGGSSGGGIFDNNGVIKGIHTSGTKTIGGKNHALGVGSIKL